LKPPLAVEAMTAGAALDACQEEPSMRSMTIGAGAAFAAISLASAPASATQYLYAYTGNDLTDVTSACCGTPDTPFTTSDFISFQFYSPYLLGANLDDTPFYQPITAWSLSIGPLHYDSTIPGSVLYSINFSTDGTGKITEYQFTTLTDVVAPGLVPAEYPPTAFEEEVFSFDFPELGYGPEDGIYIPSIYMDSEYVSNVGVPGTWTVTAVPEPANWALMMIGLGGTGAMMRRRRALAAARP
jgi:hypothetical protein